MPLHFQFGSAGLLACISAICLAATAFANGLAEARESKAGVSMRISWMVAWLVAGAAAEFLASNVVVIVFLGCSSLCSARSDPLLAKSTRVE